MDTGMRRVLLATAVMNGVGTMLFLPPFHSLRAAFGLPGPIHPLYLLIIAIWIFAFGVAYLWLAFAEKLERLFLVVAAAGKISFSLLFIGFWMAGELPGRAALLSTSDLLFGVIFLRWLYQTRATTPLLTQEAGIK